MAKVPAREVPLAPPQFPGRTACHLPGQPELGGLSTHGSGHRAIDVQPHPNAVTGECPDGCARAAAQASRSTDPSRLSNSSGANVGREMPVRLPLPPAGDQSASSEWKAASAAPRAPAMSRSGMSANVATLSCSSRRDVCSRTRPRNHSRNFGEASTTPPPTK